MSSVRFVAVLIVALLFAAVGCSADVAPVGTGTGAGADPLPTEAAESPADNRATDDPSRDNASAPEEETEPATDDPSDTEPSDDTAADAEANTAPDEQASGADDGDAIDESQQPLAAETIDWRDCGQRLQCGTVTVPIDPADPGLGTLDIAVNVHRATSVDDRIGYLFVNPGGPGVSGVDFVSDANFIFTEQLLEAFDIVGFDPRGVGASEPTFACGVGTEQFELLVQIDYPPDTDDEVDLGNDAVELCVESMGPAASRLGSQFVANDIDAIREALGADQISYLGFSYGSALGVWYAELFPDRVRSMVVDGAGDPLADADTVEEAVELARDTIVPLHDSLALALASCDSPDCPIWNDGDPEGYWYEVVEAEKFDLVLDARGGNTDAIFLGIVGHLYSDAQWPTLHESIFALGNDDPSGFLDAIEIAGVVDEASVVAHINCLDSWALFPDDTLESILEEEARLQEPVEAIIDLETPLFAALDVPDQASACMFFEALEPPAFRNVFDAAGVPILVIGNINDPFTPYIQSETLADEILADGRLVRVEHPTHTVYPSNRCVNDFVHDALIDLDYPDQRTECGVEEQGPIADLEFESVELPDGTRTAVPVDWPELAPGVWTRSLDPNDLVFIFIFPTNGDPDGTLDFFASEAGGEMEPQGTIEVDAREWSVWSLEASDGTVGRFATLPGADGVLVGGQAFPDEIDALVEQVLIPMLDAFEPAG